MCKIEIIMSAWRLKLCKGGCCCVQRITRRKGRGGWENCKFAEQRAANGVDPWAERGEREEKGERTKFLTGGCCHDDDDDD